MITVLLVEDHASYREALATVMGIQGDMQVVGEVERAEDAATVAAATQPTVAIVDLDLPDGSGVEAIGEIRRVSRETSCMVVSGLTDEAEFGRAIEAGAAAVLRKWVHIRELLDVLRVVAAGETVLSSGETARFLQALAARRDRGWEARMLGEKLTSREGEVLDALAQGADNARIARELTISVQTVQTHVRNLMAKLEVDSRLEAVVKAFELGLIKPPR